MSYESENMNFPTTPAEMLAEMARLYKYDLSEFEAMLWAAQIFTVYPDDIVRRLIGQHKQIKI